MIEERAKSLNVTPDALAKCLALTFPPSMVQLVRELVAPVPAFDTIAQIIQSDPVLSATVLTLVNSPYFALSSKVTNLERAAVVLGTREILKIALSISFQQNTSRAIKRNKKTLFADWRLSVWSSIAAEQIATRTSPKEAHLAYLGSLLKDLSLFLYLCLEHADDSDVEGNSCFLWLEELQLEQERERWGKTHAELSESLIAEWGLPDSIREGIAKHHELSDIDAYSPLTQSIIIATRWAELHHASQPNHGSIIQFELQMRTLLKLDDHQMEALRDECTQRYETILNLLGIQNTSMDSRFYAQSLQSMQGFYFHAMEIGHTSSGVEGIGKIITRQLRWNWGIDSAQLALRTSEGNGFRLFTLSPDETGPEIKDALTLSKLPWKMKSNKIVLGQPKAPFGELRFADPAKPLRNPQDMAVYSNFITTALTSYYNDQAVVVTKARTLQALPIGVALTDKNGIILDANQRFLSFQGISSSVQGIGVAKLLLRSLGIPVAALLETLNANPERTSISQLFCSLMVKDTAKTPCLYLSIHRHSISGNPALLVLLEDVTEVSALEIQVLKQRDFLELLISTMQEVIATVDLQGTILWTAPATAHLLGKSLFSVSKTSGSYSGPWDASFLKQGPAPAMPVEVVMDDGTLPPTQLELVFSPLRNAEQVTNSYLVVGRDLTLIRRLEDKIRQQAMFDGLTGLFNYSQFNTVLTREVERNSRTGRGMGLIFFDLDRFKYVNDTYGHQTGDRLLKLIAKAILQNVRKGMDFPCRYGGDEFAIVVSEVDRKTLDLLCTRIHEGVLKQCQDAVSLSLGVALLKQGETAEHLLQRVDRASYTAKQKGGAQTVWSD